MSFSGPLAGLLSITGTGTAYAGIIGDAGIDYMLTWNLASLDLGNDGWLDIQLAPLTFYGGGVLTQTATATLRSLPQPRNDEAANGVNGVPSPPPSRCSDSAWQAWPCRGCGAPPDARKRTPTPRTR